MLNCLSDTAKYYSSRMRKISDIILSSIFHWRIAWGCRRGRRTFPKLSLSRIPSIGTRITFTPETSVERWRIVATWKSCRRGQRKSRGWRGREKGDRRGIGLGMKIAFRVWNCGDDAWHRILAAFVERPVDGWEQNWEQNCLSNFARCFDQLAPFSSPRVVVSRRCLVRFEDMDGSGATTFARRKVSVNVVSFSDSQIEDKPDLSAFFVSVIMLNYATRVLRKVPINGRDGNLRDFFSFTTRRRRDPCNIFHTFLQINFIRFGFDFKYCERNCQNCFAKIISK